MKSIILALSIFFAVTANHAYAQKTVAYKSADYTLLVQELNSSLKSPWGMAFLPDNRLLITQKSGTMLIVSADGKTIEHQIENLPTVTNRGQGGLLDVVLDPDFGKNNFIYWSYAEAGIGNDKNLTGTAVARGKLLNNTLQLQDSRVIYRQTPKVNGNGHFGSRLVFSKDKTLFVTLGDRQKFMPAQDMSQSIGKVIRINRDGSVPANNPKWKNAKALPEIYSLGHRNPQGAALNPQTGELWLSEHGPQGGDEINRVLPGKNYGWPVVSYGCNYGQPESDECRLGGGKHNPKYIEPLSYWVPRSIAPAGMMFYTGDVFAKWQGNVIVGALAGTALWRVEFSGIKEIAREKLLADMQERIRDIEQGPDGMIYVITDSGKLLKISKL
jgi:glucose/arabinose dehydrogenase